MKALPPWLAPVLLAAAVLLTGYVLLVQGAMTSRVEKVADRTEHILRLEESMKVFRSAQSSLSQLTPQPLPNLQQTVSEKLGGVKVTLDEGGVLPVGQGWIQRQTRVRFENCSLVDLQGWLLGIQEADTGWRVISIELRAESTAGHASGEVELAGLEQDASMGAL